MRSSAIDHLTKILDTPAVATDLNLQLTLGASAAALRSRRARGAGAREHRVAGAVRRRAVRAARRSPASRSAGSTQRSRPTRWRPRSTRGTTRCSATSTSSRAAGPTRRGAYEQALANPRSATRELRLRYFAALLNTADKAQRGQSAGRLEGLPVTNPQDARGLLMLSRAQLELGDFANAEETARRLLAFDPTNVRATCTPSPTRSSARRDYRKVVDAAHAVRRRIPRRRARATRAMRRCSSRSWRTPTSS